MTQPPPSTGSQPATPKKPRRRLRRWIRNGFLVWATFVMLYLGNSVRTQGVDERLLQSSAAVTVRNHSDTLEFLPTAPARTGLVFLCGSGIAADAYAPLLRPVADAGYVVVIVRLPWRFAPLEQHREDALHRVDAAMRAHEDDVSRWVLAGHSLGAALCCRRVRTSTDRLQAVVLIGTTHPKRTDLSDLQLPVSKIIGERDGIAPPERVDANRHLLPESTQWIRIEGGNHSQFGHYGHQLFDGRATIDRAAQQAVVREELLRRLTQAEPSDAG